MIAARTLTRCPPWLTFACALTLVSAGCVPTSAPTVTPVEASAQPTSAPTPEPPTIQPTPVAPASADPLSRDPVAEELFYLARADLARRLLVDSTDITLVELIPVTWPDTRLGCRQEDGDYEAVEAPGYRMVLASEDETFIYHANFEMAYYCDAADELGSP